MRLLRSLCTALFTTLTTAQVTTNGLGPDSNGRYTITSTGIRALFIPYAASLTNLFINSTATGQELDIVLGYDNASYYYTDATHPHLNGVPGRYANRIKNSSFEIDGVTYHVTPNENGGADTLHGGPFGWDYRNFSVVAHTPTSITFMIIDQDGQEGFPGRVDSYITCSVSPYAWHISMTATASTKKTPIMLSSHTYWNLDGFTNPETGTVLNHSLYLPYSGQRVGVDSILIPTGDIPANQRGSVNDFWSAPKQLGAGLDSPAAVGNCGENCTGYDTCFLVNRGQNGPYDWRATPVATLASAYSGIKLDVYTQQEAYQIYSCNSMNGFMPIKSTQGVVGGGGGSGGGADSRPRTVPQYGCVVMEVEDWIDGINQPAWQRESRQIFGPYTGPYVLEAMYKFSV